MQTFVLAVGLSTARSSARLADEATFLVNQCFVTAVGALLAFGFRAVLDVFLQGAFHTVLPGVDVFAVQLQ